MDRREPELIDGEVRASPKMDEIFEQIAEMGLNGLCLRENSAESAALPWSISWRESCWDEPTNL